MWAFVGGAVEPGETTKEAALREAWEKARIADVDVFGRSPRGSYTYVFSETDRTRQDWVLHGSANLAADGAGRMRSRSSTPRRRPRACASTRSGRRLAEGW